MVYGIGLNWASAMSQDESSSAAGPSLGQIVLLLFHNVFARYLPSQKKLAGGFISASLFSYLLFLRQLILTNGD
jgi:hypothetical protein